MKRPPTIADVAEAAGVSKGTVSLALNGKGRVSEETRERVRRVAASLNYRPNVRARRLRGGRSHSVALMTTLPDAVVGGDSHLSFLLELALPLSRRLLEQGYSMLLIPPLDADDRQRVLDDIDVDGVVVVDPLRVDPVCEALRSRGVVVVTVGEVPDLEVDGVVSRGASGADVALGHLADRGARKIAVVVSSEENSVSSSVRQYVGRCVREPLLPDGVGLVVLDAPVGEGESGGLRVGRELFRSDREVDAVYAPTDAVAVGVLRAAREAGRRVPEDLLVCTNFNGPRSQNAEPPLTSLELDFSALADAAATMVVRCGESSDGHRGYMEVRPPRLVPRESTGELNPGA
ncbi:MAG: LacI family transcriptional regulator [Corynebacterium provencense]|uniref:LacI family DNA-binding transcriptional regulator n=1 Tax=Corynebacterium provencense TaxID=1737425 RepID=UPI002989DD1A|nr:LacI family transcriptional regulator [Corynebacterium provencense]